MSRSIEEQLYRELQDWPRPQYPFPDFFSPHIDELAAEYCQWIDNDCQFESEKARRVHKQHRLTDLAARGFPWMTLQELRPVARFTALFAIIDDYMDRGSREEIKGIAKKVSALLAGEDGQEPDLGFFRQVYLTRQEALACGMPRHLYQQFAESILSLMAGYSEEKQYNAAGTPPPFPVFQSIRQRSSGGTCFAKYLCMQKNYRVLPDQFLLHPTILRMHELSGLLIGYHNDFISLPKELARNGDVVNLIITVQHESKLKLKDAYMKALKIHDEHLEEFIHIQNNLPDFGLWQSTAQEYARDLGIMIQGVYSWHTKSSGRYVPGAYVEPEHKSSQECSIAEEATSSHLARPSLLDVSGQVVLSAAGKTWRSVYLQLKRDGFRVWHLVLLFLLVCCLYFSGQLFSGLAKFQLSQSNGIQRLMVAYG